MIPTGSLAYVVADVQSIALHSDGLYVGQDGWQTAAGGGGLKSRPSVLSFSAFQSAEHGHGGSPGIDLQEFFAVDKDHSVARTRAYEMILERIMLTVHVLCSIRWTYL
jgi:hypothetical protein